jgi:phosphoglycerol transferase MdoB-like AlkP superfamily enzyme
MADPSLFDPLRIPSEVLIALDNRTYHFAVQPYHYLVRMTHIVSAAAFFGGIVLFDLRLAGLRSRSGLKAFAADTLPWLYLTFVLSMISGMLLFLYDPVHAGSRAYFTPKMIMILLGLVNTLLYRRFAFGKALKEPAAVPASAKWGAALSAFFWLGVMAFSSMNAEGIPKFLLR